jgi:mannose-1-phosphate guanylyltransferase
MSGLESQKGPSTPQVSEITKWGRLVRSDERYDLFDYMVDGNTYSVTTLKPHQGTRGHSHDEVEEWYFFKTGKGRLTVGDETYEIDCGRMSASALAFRVPKGAFHSVTNLSGGPLTFVATFAGARQKIHSVYQAHGTIEHGGEAKMMRPNTASPEPGAGYGRDRGVLSRLDEETRNTQVLIFAGGLGKRMASTRPKALLEVGGEPLIDRCVEFFASCGYRDFVFLLGQGHAEVQKHIGNGSAYQIKPTFSVDEEVGQGRANSMLQALRSGKINPRRRSIVAFPDDVFTDESLPVRLILEHLHGVESQGIYASLVLTRGRQWPYGVGTVDESGLIRKFEEKPFIQQATSVGLYVFEPKVYELMERYSRSNTKWGIEDTLIPKMAEAGKLYSVFVPANSWLPVNTQKDLEQAKRILLKPKYRQRQ